MRFATLCMLALLPVLSGCGGCGSEDERGEPAEGAPARAEVDECAGLAREAAADLLGVGESDLVDDPDPTDELCVITARSDPGRALVFSVASMSSEAEAEELLAAMSASLAGLTRVDAVADLGDGAFQAEGSRLPRLLMRKGSTIVDLLEPADPESQRRVAAAIAAAL